MEHFHLLPFQKSYHIFMFNDRKSELDRLWVSDVIKNLEYYGYKSGCISDDFDIEISVFKNIQRKVKQSIITAFVISENSLKSKSFTNYMEIAVMIITESDEENPMVPILLNDSEMPICLHNYHPLIVTNRREDWWPKLLRVLENHTCSSSNGESDEDIRNLIEECKKTLATKSIKKQKKFRQLCKQSGISQFTSQMGTRTMHVGLLKGCGVEIVEQCLILKWDRFENVMIENRDTLVSIVHFNQACRLREVVINLTEEGHDKLIKGCPIWQSNLTTFIEKSLNYDFYTGIDDRMTYNVKFEGHTNYALLHSVNNIVRNLYLDNFKARCCQLDTTEKRVETFKNWPFEKHQILTFAEAGFIYTGHLDTVTCYACNQSLYGSASKDTRASLMGQHVQWSSDCSFLNIQTDRLVLDLLKQKCRSQSVLDAKASYSPYACDDKMNLSQRISANDISIKGHNLNINGIMLAEIGFTIVSPTEPDAGVACTECNYMKYGFKDIYELESCHLMWSGEQCQFLKRTKGIEAIQKFREDNDLRIQYKSSVSFKTIMINRNQ